jgi:hypothetical protein
MAAAAERDPELRARLDAMAAEAVAAERADRRRATARGWAERGVPERLFPMLHASASANDVTPEELALAPEPWPSLEAVGRFLQPSEPKTILVLAGVGHAGKTVAASWGCAFHGGRLVKAVDLIRAGMFPSDQDFWPRLERVRLLAIDDLGLEPLDARDYALACVVDLIDRRYDGARKTIITTNLAAEEFRQRYCTGPGVRMLRRVREVGRFLEVKPPAAETTP